VEGKVYPDRTDKCSSCKGEGYFPEVDETVIRQAILATKGKNKGKIRASMTSTPDRDGARAYYVWRLARFHGGKDVTMPMMADLFVRGDPFKAELDKLADSVAKEQFGTDLAAAARWGRAFGLI
jgi:hypothetical protein